MFADLLVGCLQFCHGSTEPRKVGRTQRSVVIVQILTVHATSIRTLRTSQIAPKISLTKVVIIKICFSYDQSIILHTNE